MQDPAERYHGGLEESRSRERSELLRICPMLGSLRFAFSLFAFLRFGVCGGDGNGFWRGDEGCAWLRKDGDFVLKRCRAGDRGGFGFVARFSFRLNCGTWAGWL